MIAVKSLPRSRLTELRRAARAVPEWWAELSRGYLAYLRDRGRGLNTELTYAYPLRDLGAWISIREFAALSELRLAHIEQWQAEMTGHAPSSRQVATVAIRGLLKWAAKHGVPLSEPKLWTDIESVTVPPNDPRPIPRTDLAQILKALDAPSSDLWRLRTRALFLLLYSSGARISEALSLGRDSIGEDGTARVIQKGNRPHTLVVSITACAAVADYQRARKDTCPAMFASLRPANSNAPLRRAEAQKSWNALCRELGIARFTHHRVRHSCGTTMRRQTGDVILCARHLGHRTLRMMMTYSQVDVEDRRRAVELLGLAIAG